MDPRAAILTKAIHCGNPGNDGGYLIPAGQLVSIQRRVEGSPDRIIVNAPAGFTALGILNGVEGECSADDLTAAPPAWTP